MTRVSLLVLLSFVSAALFGTVGYGEHLRLHDPARLAFVATGGEENLCGPDGAPHVAYDCAACILTKGAAPASTASPEPVQRVTTAHTAVEGSLPLPRQSANRPPARAPPSVLRSL